MLSRIQNKKQFTWIYRAEPEIAGNMIGWKEWIALGPPDGSLSQERVQDDCGGGGGSVAEMLTG